MGDELSIKGDRMEMLSQGDVVVFTGNVRIKGKGIECTAGKIRYDRKNEVYHAFSNVYFKDSSGDNEVIESWCGSMNSCRPYSPAL